MNEAEIAVVFVALVIAFMAIVFVAVVLPQVGIIVVSGWLIYLLVKLHFTSKK